MSDDVMSNDDGRLKNTCRCGLPTKYGFKLCYLCAEQVKKRKLINQPKLTTYFNKIK